MSSPIKEVTREQLDILMLHLLRCPEVFHIAVSKLQLEDFDMTQLQHRLIWAIATEFYTQYRSMIPETMLHGEIEANTRDSPEFFPYELKDTIHALVKEFFAKAEKELIASYALNILESFLYQRRVKLRMLDGQERNEDTRELLATLNKQAETTRIQRGRVIEPFDLLGEGQLGATQRISTGIPFLDMMMGGGHKPYEVHGFLAPSGGGKTTLSNQLAIAYASLGRHAYVFSYEEPLGPDYFIPVLACASQIPRMRIEQAKTPDDFTPAERERYIEARKRINKHLHYVDMSGIDAGGAGSGGAAEISAALRQFETQGLPIDLFVIDWFWPMMQRYMNTVPVEKGKQIQDRTFAQRCVDEIKSVAQQHRAWCWLNHQMAPAAAGKKKGAAWHDAAEFKSFAWYLNGCFVLESLGKNSVGKLYYSKARNAETTNQPVQLDGAVATFRSLGSDFAWSDRDQTYVRRADVAAVPSDHEQDESTEPEVPSTLAADLTGQTVPI